MDKITPFKFEEVKDFDRHIDLSIPNYQTLNLLFTSITKEFAQPESKVIDLGCSTGRFLSSLPKVEGCEYIGIDTISMRRHEEFNFIQEDCEKALKSLMATDVSVIVSMFFLQFLGYKKRDRILKQIKYLIERGAVFLVSEKVYLDDARLQNLIHRLHIQNKREGFTDKEILDKDRQLAISMFCQTEYELEAELKALGKVNKVWQSYNFMGYVIQKKE